MIGTELTRVEDERILRGGAEFVSNLDLDGAAVVGFVVSTVPHARITDIRAEDATGVPGVLAIVTASDVALPAIHPGLGDIAALMPRPLLATDVVRYVGEPIVAIVAEHEAAIADARDLIEIVYEQMPAVMTLDDAARDDVVLFPEVGTNTIGSATGGSDAALPFDDCDVVVELDSTNQRLAPAPLETRAAASDWTDTGRLLHWSSCQGPHPIRTQLAEIYGLEPEQVRVRAPDVGGSFGAKGRASTEELLLPELARRVGRPVRWVPSRSDDMIGLAHGRAQHHRVRLGGDRDGTLRCLDVEITGDSGAYPGFAAFMTTNTGLMLPGPYRIEHVSWSSRTLLTTTTPIGAYRGAGRPEAAALLERAVDAFAVEIGLDPVELRRRNLIGADQFPNTSPTGLVYDSGDYQRSLEVLVEQSQYDRLREDQDQRRRNDDPIQLGIGLACFVDRTGGANPAPEYGATELRPDGGLRVYTGSSPYGQGHRTAWAMIASDRTGIPIADIEVVHGDTDVIPRGSITAGSRSAQIAGSAVAAATDMMIDEARRLAADLLEADAGDIVLDVDGARFHVAGAPASSSVSWKEIAARTNDGPLHCETDFAVAGGSFPFGAYLAVVLVDTSTGEVRLRDLFTVDDAGTILNPLLAFGQVHGGAAQGVAQALYEQFVYDDDGNPLTATFLDYLIPSAAELPLFDCSFVETPSPNNLLGCKGIGESGCIGAPPAVQNAVIDALRPHGPRHLDMPLTPERVWRAINA